jgi:DNA polymerase-4
MARWPKIIVHADMDAFYAAVEQRDNPRLRGKPILIGPNSNRGVVLTASYEARPFQVGSGMGVAEARRRCPHAIMVPPRFSVYQAVSAQIMDIFADFSPSVEAISLDEAFLDMTGAEHFFGQPKTMGERIKRAVFEATQLHISVGISGTKYVAKVASAHDKPNGLTVVPQEEAVSWLAPLPVNRLWGVGRKTLPKLNAVGLYSIGDIAALDERELINLVGISGRRFHKLSHAKDPRFVARGRAASSLGSDRTLSKDVSSRAEVQLHLRRAAERIARRVRKKDYVAGGIRVRLKTTRHELLTRQCQFRQPQDTANAFYQAACKLLPHFAHPGPFRLVGISAFNLNWRDEPLQQDLFEDLTPRDLETTIDDLINRFGQGAVVRASDLAHEGTIMHDGVNLDYLDYRDGERVSTPA